MINIKYIMIFAVIFGWQSTNAQRLIDSLDVDTHQEYMDVLLSNLIENDSALFKNGILYDRVFSKTNLNEFNTTNHNEASYHLFMNIWEELNQANLTKEPRLETEIAKDLAFSSEMKNDIALGIINIDYTTLDTLALDSTTIANGTGGLTLDSDGLLAKVSGTNPYINKHKVIIAPLASRIIHENQITLSLSPMILDKSSKIIEDLSVSFGGNTINLIQNEAFENLSTTFTFNDSGSKIFNFHVKFTDGTSLLTSSVIKVKLLSPAQILLNSQIQTITATESFVGYDELSPCGFPTGIYGSASCYGQGEYLVLLADGHTQLTKPVILMDGFDPLDGRGILEANIDDETSILEIMEYYDGSSKKNITTVLQEEGYDVIILNFPKYKNGTGYLPYNNAFAWAYEGAIITNQTIAYQKYRDGGADYIERNANVLKELIRQTNQTLTNNGSSEKLVVIGPSMGGLISRVALRQMEINYENHNTRIYVSFDAPHKGANIAMGVQKLMQRTRSLELYQLKTPAAKQMLLNHYLEHDNWESPQPHSFRTNNFVPLLNSLGFPVQTNRNIAWLNGSLYGNEIGVAGQKFVDLTALWSDLEIRRTNNANSTGVLKYKTPFNSSLWKHTQTHPWEGSLDASPGGAIALTKGVIEGWNGESPWIAFSDYNTSFTAVVDDESCFIPTKSSLAYSGTNTSWRENLSCQNLICKGWTPFDNYFAPDNNEFHITVTQNGVDWILDELNGTPTYIDAISWCPDFITEIEGSNILCKDEIATYTINNDCGISYWESSNGIDILSSNGTSATIEKTSSSSYNKWIKAVLWTGEEIIKDIVSRPIFTWGTDGFNTNSNAYEISITPTNLTFAQQGVNTSNIVWTQTGGNGTLNVSPDKLSATATHTSWPFIVTGTVAITNEECQTTTIKSFFASDPLTPPPAISYDPNSGWGGLFILNSAININAYLVVDPDMIGSAEISSSELFDIFGNQVEQFIHNQDHVTIDNATGNPQTRILQVTMNGKTAQKTIIVQ